MLRRLLSCLLLFLFYVAVPAAEAHVVRIKHGRELAPALADPSVLVVELEGDIALRDEDWQGLQLPVVLHRNVTLRPVAGLPFMPVLDFNFVRAKVQLMPTHEFIILGVIGDNYRAGAPIIVAPGLDFFAESPKPQPSQPRPIVRVKDGGSLYRLCLSAQVNAAASARVRVPPELPGTTANFSNPTSPSGCSTTSLHPMDRCWTQLLVDHNKGLEAMQLSAVGVAAPANYVLNLVNFTAFCPVVVSDDCVAQHGALACWATTFSALQPAPRWAQEALLQGEQDRGPANGNSAGAGQKGAQLHILLPAVLGGVLAAVAVQIWAVAVWRRRKIAAQGKAETSGASQGSGSVAKACNGVVECGSNEALDGAPPAIQAGAADAPQVGSCVVVAMDGPPVRLAAGSYSGAAAATLGPLTEQTPPCPHVRLDLKLGTDVLVDHNALRGAGTFGRVVEGNYQGSRVAVKLLHAAPQARTAQQDAANSLRQEAHVLSRCNHPNVVAFLGACLSAPHLCLVMELMDQSLQQLLEQQAQPLPLQQVLKIAIDMACGLAYLHPTVVHRDLKPANVLLAEDGTSKLSDFGLARLRMTVCKTLNPEAGTVPYTAPECFEPTNFIVTHKADLYSWAVVVWQMLTGREPWGGLAPMAIALTVTYNKQRLPLNVLPEQRCPGKLRDVLAECWEADPQRRPSAEEVVKRLVLLQQALERAASATTSEQSYAVEDCSYKAGSGSKMDSLITYAHGAGSVEQPPSAHFRALDLPTVVDVESTLNLEGRCGVPECWPVCVGRASGPYTMTPSHHQWFQQEQLHAKSCASPP